MNDQNADGGQRGEPGSSGRTQAARPVGLTRDTGWELGASKTFDAEHRAVWLLVTSLRGGELIVSASEALVPGSSNEGAAGAPVLYEITTYVEYSHIRMRWKRRGWEQWSMVQIRVIAKAKGRTTVSVLQDRLTSEGMRETMLLHWKKVLADIGAALK